ncbi:hypothetical protein CAC42_2219 [Sphaceloma murrayae]|uniref:Uncharacterized protein n=1 Tax=Sphaceloma murrayae TaxID=2082308 RepID=A0A2K1QJB5_9PEZI|nr:hypothetical protein CAC42_2219 [Sphaceloma murrayae]
MPFGYGGRCDSQALSVLFKLPPEIRAEIWTYAIAPTQTGEYHKHCSWKWPGVEGPITIDLDLLRTCKRIYCEASASRPKDRDITVYWCSPCYRPLQCTNPYILADQLAAYRETHGHDMKVGHLRIFATNGGTSPFPLSLRTQHLSPSRITLTLRYVYHDDFYMSHGYTYLFGQFSTDFKPKRNLECLTIEFEGLMSRKCEVDATSELAANNWTFRREGLETAVPIPPESDFSLTADFERRRVTTWTGSSTVNDTRWIRDESRPGELEFYTVAITWDTTPKPPRPVVRRGHPGLEFRMTRRPDSERRRMSPFIRDEEWLPTYVRLWPHIPREHFLGRVVWATDPTQQLNPDVCVYDPVPDETIDETGRRLITSENLAYDWIPFDLDDPLFQFKSRTHSADRRFLFRFRHLLLGDDFTAVKLPYIIEYVRHHWAEWKRTGMIPRAVETKKEQRRL